MNLMRTPPPANIGRAVGLLLAGIVLIDAIFVCSVAPIAALCFAASFPLLLLWQRKIAAT
jgi:4-hydroxybenzoate polyprenyltransferase